MKKDCTALAKISFRKRIILIISSLFLLLVLLEAGLRLGGFIILSLQEHRNLVSIKTRGQYRIMCLGESTTAIGGSGSYPSQLEDILNQRNTGIQFSVINEGMIGANTSIILSGLQAKLDMYSPNMVIAMMGNNDFEVMYYKDMPDADTNLFLHFRAYRFIWLVYMQIIRKIAEEGFYGSNADLREGQKFKKEEMMNPQRTYTIRPIS